MAGRTAAPVRRPPPPTAAGVTASQASVLAAEIKGLLAAGQREEARERFGALVALLQRRAVRVAFHYLRDAADTDEAVQDAFIKVFLHMDQYQEALSFDAWFTRILVHASLDRLKARARQQRLITTIPEGHEDTGRSDATAVEPSSERRLLAQERWTEVSRKVAALPDRQRLVFTLRHVDEQTPAEIAAATGMSPATVRVHLFRALRKLRSALGDEG